ncbi:MAG: ribonuclease P protein component [Mobiluncus sp.]|nr:ribonuclease P protein component [Mobiluncus sp.]
MSAADFRLAMRKGVRFTRPNLVAFHVRTEVETPPRIGFIVPKKSVRLATGRNLVKRRLRSAIRERLSLFPSGSLTVFLARGKVDKVSFTDLNLQLATLIERLQNHYQENEER